MPARPSLRFDGGAGLRAEDGQRGVLSRDDRDVDGVAALRGVQVLPRHQRQLVRGEGPPASHGDHDGQLGLGTAGPGLRDLPDHAADRLDVGVPSEAQRPANRRLGTSSDRDDQGVVGEEPPAGQHREMALGVDRRNAALRERGPGARRNVGQRVVDSGPHSERPAGRGGRYPEPAAGIDQAHMDGGSRRRRRAPASPRCPRCRHRRSGPATVPWRCSSWTACWPPARPRSSGAARFSLRSSRRSVVDAPPRPRRLARALNPGVKSARERHGRAADGDHSRVGPSRPGGRCGAARPRGRGRGSRRRCAHRLGRRGVGPSWVMAARPGGAGDGLRRRGRRAPAPHRAGRRGRASRLGVGAGGRGSAGGPLGEPATLAAPSAEEATAPGDGGVRRAARVAPGAGGRPAARRGGPLADGESRGRRPVAGPRARPGRSAGAHRAVRPHGAGRALRGPGGARLHRNGARPLRDDRHDGRGAGGHRAPAARPRDPRRADPRRPSAASGAAER